MVSGTSETTRTPSQIDNNHTHHDTLPASPEMTSLG
jgi:hypothetical protein